MSSMPGSNCGNRNQTCQWSIDALGINNIIIICYIYIALFWVLKALYIVGGIWMMRQQLYCARTPATHQLTGGEETVMQPISVRGWLGGHDGQRPMGKFGQDAGVTPLLFFEGHPGILTTTESQDLGLTSHPKDGACWQYSVPVTTLGC